MYQYQELTPLLTPLRVSWNLAGISLWGRRASKVLEDWASHPWMRRDQSGPLGGSIQVPHLTNPCGRRG